MEPLDPIATDPDAYRVVFENDRVRVLEYTDQPGHRTRPHRHPDSVMVPLASFSRRLGSGGREVDVDVVAGVPRWLAAQEHYGENVGDRPSHAVFVELKEPRRTPVEVVASLGPSSA